MCGVGGGGLPGRCPADGKGLGGRGLPQGQVRGQIGREIGRQPGPRPIGDECRQRPYTIETMHSHMLPM